MSLGSCKSDTRPMAHTVELGHLCIGVGVTKSIFSILLFPQFSASSKYRTYWWISARKLSLQCVSNGVMSFLHYAIDILNITFVFGRCRRSLAAMTSVKYEGDSRNLISTFVKSEIPLTEKLMNRDLVTPPLIYWWKLAGFTEAVCFQGVMVLVTTSERTLNIHIIINQLVTWKILV